MADGYGFTWHGVYWASLTTGGRSTESRHDLYLGPVAASGHAHHWVKFPSGALAVMGVQMKEQGVHLVPGNHLESFSTRPIIRGHARRDPRTGAVTTEISALVAGSAYSGSPATSVRSTSRRDPMMLTIPLPPEATWFDFEVALAPKVASGDSSSGPGTLLPLAGSSPLAVRLSITSWGT